MLNVQVCGKAEELKDIVDLLLQHFSISSMFFPSTQEMLEWSKAEELNQALSLVLAIFHMDLEHLSHSLLLTLMPRLLLSTVHTHVLSLIHI